MENQTEIVELTADIVAAYVGNNAVPAADLTKLISDIHKALAGAVAGKEEVPQEELKPAVPVRRSVTPDAIICLEDGLKFKSLKRHLRTHHDTTPEEYRGKWGLPHDYPMVAPSYAQARSRLAKEMGLGQKSRHKRK